MIGLHLRSTVYRTDELNYKGSHTVASGKKDMGSDGVLRVLDSLIAGSRPPPFTMKKVMANCCFSGSDMANTSYVSDGRGERTPNRFTAHEPTIFSSYLLASPWQ